MNYQPTKFAIGDKARVCSNKGDTSDLWLKHFLEIGKEVVIAGVYDGWKKNYLLKGYEAYTIKGSSEILLAEELAKINIF